MTSEDIKHQLIIIITGLRQAPESNARSVYYKTVSTDHKFSAEETCRRAKAASVESNQHCLLRLMQRTWPVDQTGLAVSVQLSQGYVMCLSQSGATRAVARQRSTSESVTVHGFPTDWQLNRSQADSAVACNGRVSCVGLLMRAAATVVGPGSLTSPRSPDFDLCEQRGRGFGLSFPTPALLLPPLSPPEPDISHT